jgi:uncharacterized protein YbcI
MASEELAAVRDQHQASVLSQISNEMVHIYKEQFGRGPTKARTDFASANLVIATLEESLTQAERNLAAIGEHQRLRDVRMLFQYASREHFVTSVERLTGRRVRAFVSGIDSVADVSSEVFYLDAAPPVLDVTSPRP